VTKGLVVNVTTGVGGDVRAQEVSIVTRSTHAARFTFIAGLLVFALALVPAALAGKGGGGKSGGGSTSGGGGSSLSLVLMNSTDGLPHYGQQVTFNVSTTATTRPYVNLDCTQNGALVYSNQVGYYPDYPWVQYFVLSSSYWTGGSADCIAKLTYWNGRSWSTLTSISVHVYA
jgi:hypothetical protein